MNYSHPLANQQIDAVNKVLQELDVTSIPKLIVWNKVWLYLSFIVTIILFSGTVIVLALAFPSWA